MRGIPKMLSSEDCIRTELFLNPKDLIVFCKTVGPPGSSALNLTGAQTNNEVSDKVILGFTTAVGYHDAPAGFLWHVASLDGLSDWTNLVDLKQQSVAKLLINSVFDSLGVGNQKVITNDLNFAAYSVRELDVRVEIVLVKWILNRLDGIIFCQILIQIEQGIWGHHSIGGAKLLT